MKKKTEAFLMCNKLKPYHLIFLIYRVVPKKGRESAVRETSLPSTICFSPSHKHLSEHFEH